MNEVCDWCEEPKVVEFRVDTIERGEGFSYDVDRECRDAMLAELGENDLAETYVERVDRIDD